MYISKPWADIIDNPVNTANNHILNSLAAKFFITTFKDDLFFLRLPALIGQLMYLLFTALIVRHLFKDSFWQIACFLLLQLNPFLFDFWGLCRGYGLAISCMTGTVFFLLYYMKTNRAYALLLSFLFLIAGIYTNFSLLYVATGLIAVLAIHMMYRGKAAVVLKTSLITVAASVLAYLIIQKPLSLLIERKELYYGGETGFMKDTIGTLLQETFYLKENNTTVFAIAIGITVLVLLMGGYWLVRLRKNRSEDVITGLCLWLLLFIPALTTIVQHTTLGSKFLLDRTALFFYPLFFINVLFLVSQLKLSGALNKVAVLILLGVFGFNFLAHASLNTTRIWYYDRHVPWLMQRMMTTKQNEGKIKIYLEWLFTPSLSYYVNRDYEDKFGYLEKQNEVAYEKDQYDFYLIRDWEVHKVPETYMLDTVFADSLFYLYKRKQWDNNEEAQILIPENTIFAK